MKRGSTLGRTCSLEMCDNKHYARGFCKQHYTAEYSPYYRERRRLRGTPCSIDGCDGWVESRCLCHAHYERWRKTGEPSTPGRTCWVCGKEYFSNFARKQVCGTACSDERGRIVMAAVRFGITPESYRSIMAGAACALCGRTSKDVKKMALDHDHKTGKIRGPLCGMCNTGLGMFQDRPDLLRLAADYLDHHSRS